MLSSVLSVRRNRRATLAALVLPLASLSAVAPAAHADVADEAPGATLTWKLSNHFVDHFTPKFYAPNSSLVASDGATLDAVNVTTFSGGTGWSDPATGAASVSYDGTVTGTFVANGATQYILSISDPEIRVTGGEGQILGDVDWTVPSATPSTGGSDEVVLTTFDATAEDWAGRSLTATPDWDNVLAPDSPEATALGIPAGQPVGGRSWAPEFLTTLDPGLRGHFYASAKASDANKPPSEFTAIAPAPSAQVTSTATPEGLRVHVEGSGFAPTGTGIYVGLTEAGEIDPTNANAYLGTRWLPASAIAADGTFATDLDLIAKDDLDSSLTYEVHTLKAHGVPDRSQDVREPVEIDFAALEPTAPTLSAPSISRVHGQGGTLVATVPGATGTVGMVLGSYRPTVALIEGRATFTIPRALRGGTHTARFTYSGSVFHTPASATSRVTVRAAKTRTVVRVTKVPTRKKTGAASVTVANASGTGLRPVGRVTVVMRKGKSAVTRVAGLRNGVARFVLPKRAKGVWTVTATYAGQATNFARSTQSVKVRVRR